MRVSCLVALLVHTASGLKIAVPVPSRRNAVRSALSALVLAPASAAIAASNAGNYADEGFQYELPPAIPGYQAVTSSGPPKAAAASAQADAVGPELAKLFATSKASLETNSGLKMTPDEEKKLMEKLRKKYPGVANR